MSMDDTRHRPGRLAERVREKREAPKADTFPSPLDHAFAQADDDVDVFRASIAGVDAETAAAMFQSLLGIAETDVLDATFTDSYGAGGWGVESGVTIETATPNAGAFVDLVADYLRTFDQECAYVTVNGRHAYEITDRGLIHPITGE